MTVAMTAVNYCYIHCIFLCRIVLDQFENLPVMIEIFNSATYPGACATATLGNMQAWAPLFYYTFLANRCSNR